jgi:hypothetical protein
VSNDRVRYRFESELIDQSKLVRLLPIEVGLEEITAGLKY